MLHKAHVSEGAPQPRTCSLVNEMLLQEVLLAGAVSPPSAPCGGGTGPDMVTWFPPLLSAPSRLFLRLCSTPRVLTKEGDRNLLFRRFK